MRVLADVLLKSPTNRTRYVQERSSHNMLFEEGLTRRAANAVTKLILIFPDYISLGIVHGQGNDQDAVVKP